MAQSGLRGMTRVSRQRRFSLILILLAAILAWWLARDQEDMLFSPKPLLRHEPDYILEDFSLTVAAEDGSPRYRMSGLSMKHYPDTDVTFLEQPRMEIIVPDGGLWLITARQAQTDKKGDLVHLEGDVSIHRNGDPAAGLTLETDALDVNVDDESAATDLLVTIRQEFGVTRAQGLRINFQQRHLYLKSEVRGEYVLPAD